MEEKSEDFRDFRHKRNIIWRLIDLGVEETLKKWQSQSPGVQVWGCTQCDEAYCQGLVLNLDLNYIWAMSREHRD